MAKIALERDSFNFHTDYVPLKATSFAELQDILAKGVENNINFVNGTDEDFWLQTYTLKPEIMLSLHFPELEHYVLSSTIT